MKVRAMRVLLAVLLLATMFPGMAAAHTVMKSSVPIDGETVGEPVQTVTATFGQNIQSFSTMTVLNEEGQAVDPVQVTVDGKVLQAEFAPALGNGKYTAEWKVVASDGHTVKGKFSFVVAGAEPEVAPDASEIEPPAAESSEGEPIAEEEPAHDTGNIEFEPAEPEATPEADPEAEAAEPVTETSKNNTFLITAAVILLVIVAAGMIMVTRKPRR